jgi:hypothetical protein
MLAALLLPKCLVALWLYGDVSASYILDSDLSTPGFWSGWLGSMLLVLLTYVWFGWSQTKRFSGEALVLLLASIALLVVAALGLHVPLGSGIALDVIGMLVVLYLASVVTDLRQILRVTRDASGAKRGRSQPLIEITTRLLSLAGWIGLAVCVWNAFGGGLTFLPIYFLSWVFMLAAAFAVRETGHFVGATVSGMKVQQVRWLALELYPRRGRWLLRWAPDKGRSFEGLVYAAWNPSRSLRTQSLTMAAMGPAANVLVALLSAGVAWTASARPALFWLASAFAIVNGVMGIANLLPRTGRFLTDGARLRAWWRHTDDHRPNLAYNRLLSLSVFGTTAEALPEADIAYLEKQPMPAPLMAMWYRLKGAQHGAEWSRVLELGVRFEWALAAWPQPPNSMRAFIEQFRAEVAFSRVLATGDIAPLHDELLSRDAKRLSPSLWPRCMALKAMMMGSSSESARLLEQCMAEAKRLPDLALPKSEAILARYILQKSSGP